MDSDTVTSLEASTGQVRLIDFWSTGCGPCKRELPSLAVLAHDLGSEPFTLLSVNIDEDMADRGAAIRRALGGAAGAYPVLLDDGSASSRYAVYRIPFKVLVDRAGVVRRVYTGGTDPDELRADIQEVLGGKG
jgi:thiol-disulfide isomerase/thioredoxin